MFSSFITPEWLRITRPIQVLTVLMGTWASAIVLGGHAFFSTEAIAVSIAMGLLSLAGSLFHAGYTSPSAPCARRFVDTPHTGNRQVILFLAGIAFMGCFFTAARFLSWFQVMFIIVTACMLFIYCDRAGTNNYWFDRNTMFAVIATMPISIGSINTGGDPNAISPAHLPLFFAVFMLYFTRETVKTAYEAQRGGAHHELPIGLMDRTVFFGLQGAAQIVMISLGLVGIALLIMFTSIRATGADISMLSVLPIFSVFGLLIGMMLVGVKMIPHLQRAVTACVWLTAASLVVGKIM